MTLNDIKKEVAHLGFESESAIDSSIESATRRAIATAYTEHGVQAVGRIYQSSLPIRSHVAMLVHTGGGEEMIHLCGCTYAFVVSGKGAIEITDGNGRRTQSFDAEGGYVYGSVIGDAEMRFVGEFGYTVYDFCTYEGIFADGERPPEYGRMRRHELSKVLPDFLCAVSAPTDKDGRVIEGAAVISDVMMLPYGYTGEAVIRYRKRAPEVSINTPDRELGIAAELEPLIPLLAAAYVWLDDDADKAQYYMSLYRDGMSAVKLYTRRCVDTAFTDVTGWAG